ncbi:hypothetical protein NE865_03398 [Phthorimaea operculella]|nr:hypothetical protein NE865_03398 [Phthorimaea operculella]
MDEDSMIRLCITAFKPEEVSDAKNLLFSSLKAKAKRKKITRKKEGKTQRDVEDIISLIKEVSPEDLPIFVARDLHKLPPVTFDHLDATRLLRDLITLKNEIETIKDTYVPIEQHTQLKNEVVNLQRTSIVNNFHHVDDHHDRFVNKNRGVRNVMDSCDLYNCDSGPFGIIHITQKSQQKSVDCDQPSEVNTNSTLIDEKLTQQDQAHRMQPSLSHSLAVSPGSKPSITDAPIVTSQDQTHRKQSSLSHSLPASPGCPPSISDAPITRRVEAPTTVSVNKQDTSNDKTGKMTNDGPQANDQLFHMQIKTSDIRKNEEEWKTVQRKRYRNRFIGEKGTCTETAGSFKAASSSKLPFFINNVHKDTCENDIVSYVRNRIGVTVTLCKIKSKQPKEYNSYKMFIPKDKLDLFLDCNLWPDGITFRRFVEFRERDLRDKRRSY